MAGGVLINPRLLAIGDKVEEDWEDCCGLPKLHGKVPRYAEIEIEALDHRGRSFTVRATGSLARILQHECDHLAGRIFLDRMKSLGSLAYQEESERYWAGQEAR